MHILAATGDGLYAIDADGNAKQLVPGDVGAITRAPDGSRWLVVDDHDVVVLRDDAVDDTERLQHSGELLTCITATCDDVFVGTVGAHVLHLVDGSLARVESFEVLAGRDEWTQPWGAPGDLRSFATDRRDTVFANVHVGGVLRTQDGGDTWVQTIDHNVDVHQVTRAADGRLFAATGAAGLASSTDDGATWEYVTDGLHGTYARAVAAVPGGVVCSASTGPFSREAALYLLRDDANRFVRCDAGIPDRFDGNIDSHWVASAGEHVACVAPDGTLYGSDDGGITWRTVTSGLRQPRALLVED
jgi:hypothetical protein